MKAKKYLLFFLLGYCIYVAIEVTYRGYSFRLMGIAGEDSRINSMIRFIEEHYREDISAADLSERFGLSASYISSLLKTALGVRYSDYVAGLRLNHAKELLATTHMTVKDITVECGWYSQSYFTKLFIEREGCTPVEYRKSFGK